MGTGLRPKAIVSWQHLSAASIRSSNTGMGMHIRIERVWIAGAIRALLPNNEADDFTRLHRQGRDADPAPGPLPQTAK